MEQEFSVEQGFNIAIVFLHNLWELIEPELTSLDPDPDSLYRFFFLIVCLDDEASAEWNEAIFRIKKIPKAAQRELLLSIDDLFLCTLEFCRLHHERFETGLPYVLNLLESMKSDPSAHRVEWSLWKDAIIDVINKLSFVRFNWNRRLP